jgi:hypothetical protein
MCSRSFAVEALRNEKTANAADSEKTALIGGSDEEYVGHGDTSRSGMLRLT